MDLHRNHQSKSFPHFAQNHPANYLLQGFFISRPTKRALIMTSICSRRWTHAPPSQSSLRPTNPLHRIEIGIGFQHFSLPTAWLVRAPDATSFSMLGHCLILMIRKIQKLNLEINSDFEDELSLVIAFCKQIVEFFEFDIWNDENWWLLPFSLNWSKFN